MHQDHDAVATKGFRSNSIMVNVVMDTCAKWKGTSLLTSRSLQEKEPGNLTASDNTALFSVLSLAVRLPGSFSCKLLLVSRLVPFHFAQVSITTFSHHRC
jgi:hypothetical protein